MENLSHEELMRRVKYKHGTFDADEAESELLSRLNRLAEAESQISIIKQKYIKERNEHANDNIYWFNEVYDRQRRLAEAESQLEKLKYTVRLASTWLGEYINDSDNATHAKRILQNEIISWQSDGLTMEERK